VVWDENGLAEREWRQGPEIMRTHCMAAVGYMVHRRSPYGELLDAPAPVIVFSEPEIIEPRLI
jgi:hypothetical protein